MILEEKYLTQKHSYHVILTLLFF